LHVAPVVKLYKPVNSAERDAEQVDIVM